MGLLDMIREHPEACAAILLAGCILGVFILVGSIAIALWAPKTRVDLMNVPPRVAGLWMCIRAINIDSVLFRQGLNVITKDELPTREHPLSPEPIVTLRMSSPPPPQP